MAQYYVSRNEEDVLCHSGILGQKWGVRRWQNEDGTLTEEGKIHYSKQQNKEDERHKAKMNKLEIKNLKKQNKAEQDKLKSELESYYEDDKRRQEYDDARKESINQKRKEKVFSAVRSVKDYTISAMRFSAPILGTILGLKKNKDGTSKYEKEDINNITGALTLESSGKKKDKAAAQNKIALAVNSISNMRDKKQKKLIQPDPKKIERAINSATNIMDKKPSSVSNSISIATAGYDYPDDYD